MKENEASSTAYTVSQGIVLSGRYSKIKDLVPRPLLQSSEYILQSTNTGRGILRQLKNPIRRSLLKVFERLTLPGMSLHYVLRKMYIEKCTRQAIEFGAKQVIILGAGFDTLSLRLSKQHKSVKFIEVDHPATSRDKKRAIKDKLEHRCNYFLVANDFSRRSLSEALANCDEFNADLHSVFVCEGVMMYLSKNDVDKIFTSIQSFSAKSKQVVFTALEPLISPDNDSNLLLKAYLRIKGESLNWTHPQKQISSFLERHKYQMIETVDDSKIAETMLPNLTQKRFHRGEYVVFCSSYS